MLKTEKDRVIHDLKCQIQEAKDRNEFYIFFPWEKIEKLIEYVENVEINALSDALAQERSKK